MDITLARTFLEIVTCGNFVRAAERLHVTQTAVSVRVQTLEALLGRKLFVRNKAGASLTPAGEQFTRYASLLVQVWERARQQVAVPPGLRAVVAVAGELSLWNPFLLDWLVWMRRSAPQLALRAQRLLHDERRVVRLKERVRAPLLRAPAEHAPEVAGVDRGRHLEAAGAVNPVEGLLVAAHALRQAGLRPVAELHSAVAADDAVALALQDLPALGIHPGPDEGAG